MSSDLLFSILPRLGKEPPIQDEHVVEQVSKEARLRELNDEEKELNAEEREAREKYQKKDEENPSDENASSSESQKHESHNYVDDEGQQHIDDYA